MSDFDATAAEAPHPDVQQVLDLVEAAPDVHELPPAEARMAFEAAFPEGEPAAEVGAVEDRTIPGPAGDLPVRIYEPRGGASAPPVVYAHGGGFVLGDLDTHDDTCRVLCEAAETVVVSVDYRLAPEHPFPAAVEDVYAATEWVEANLADGGVAVAGDSAGGTLVAVTTLLARDRRRRGESAPEIVYQGLLYPATDVELYPSVTENAGGYFLTAEEMAYFHDHYLSHELHGHNRYAFPTAARDLSGLPPATVVTAGFDPLRDEGAAYAERLADAGVEVTFRNHEDMIHGFASMLALDVARAREELTELGADLAAAGD
ncbi:alpha/beta hydrolase [Halobacteriales archaeon QS_1_68_20]|nr:MAG: alpha/beta hydrolase [Halobacteriales archaeon QS_1_68_20]